MEGHIKTKHVFPLDGYSCNCFIWEEDSYDCPSLRNEVENTIPFLNVDQRHVYDIICNVVLRKEGDVSSVGTRTNF